MHRHAKAVGCRPTVFHVTFTATVEGETHGQRRDDAPAYFDAVVEVCRPAPSQSECTVKKAGRFEHAAGAYAAAAKVDSDFAWWQSPPGDLPAGE